MYIYTYNYYHCFVSSLTIWEPPKCRDETEGAVSWISLNTSAIVDTHRTRLGVRVYDYYYNY